jgi:hypothetical protein
VGGRAAAGRDHRGPTEEASMTGFKQPILKELTDQQVRFAPPARRQEQVSKAEKLLAEIDPGRVYPYSFIC